MSRKTSAGLLRLLSSLLLCAGPQALFNGKNLKGWTLDLIDTLMNEATGLSATKGTICRQSKGTEIQFRKV